MKPKTSLLRFLAIAGSLMLAITSASAQGPYYWDGNNDASGFGAASGTWAAPTAGTATSGWSTSSTGVTAVDGNSVSTTTTDSLNFGTNTAGFGLAAGTITVSGTVNAGSITFGSQSGTITLSGGTINLAGTTTISANSTMTIESLITGAGTSLTKAAGGTLRLTNTANTYTGATLIGQSTGGVLEAMFLADGGVASSIGASSSAAGNLVLSNINAGVLRYIGSTDASSNRLFTLGNQQGYAGGFESSGTGTLNLTGTGAVAFAQANQVRVFSLGGTNTGQNILNARLIDNGTGALSFIKNGTGTWVLANSSNSYTGTTTVSAGTLITTTAAALSGYNSSGKVVFNGGTVGARIGSSGWTTGEVDALLTNATKTSGALGIDTTNGSLTQWTAFTTTNFGTTIGLNKLGSNTLTLDQTNNYAGATTVTEGVLNIQIAGALGATTNGTTVRSGATLEIQGGITTAAEALTLNGSGISSGGALRNISGNNTYAGNITLGSSARINSDADLLTASGTVAIGGNTLTVGGASNTTISGTITGSGNLTKVDAGTLALTNTTNTYSGTITVNGGILDVSGTGRLSSGNHAGGITVGSGGTLRFSTSSGQTLSGSISLGGAITVSGSNSLALSGAITGGGSITMSGSSTISLSNSGNSYSGGFTLNSGQVANIQGTTYNGFGAGTLTINGGQLRGVNTAATTIIPNDIQWNASTIGFGRASGGNPTWALNGNVMLGGNVTTTQVASTEIVQLIFNGNVSDGGLGRSFTFTSGVNAVTFNGQNTFTGNMTQSAGTVTIGGSGYLGGGNYAGTISSSGAVTYSSSANQILSGNVSGTTLTKNTSADSMLTLSGTNSFSSTTTVTAGTLLATKAASLSGYTTASRIIFNGGTIGVQVGGSGWTTTQVNTLLTNATKTSGALGIDTTNGNLTQWAVFTTTNLGASLGLTKLGANALTLDQANTYTGSTTVSGGKLFVNNTTGSGTGSGNVTVGNGATLGGSGIISGNVTTQNGGTFAAGTSIESLATGSLTQQAGSTFAYEANNNVAASVAGDLTAVTGNLTFDLTNAAILTLAELGTGSWAATEKLTLISYTGTWNGGLFKYLGNNVADDSSIVFSGYNWTFNYNDTAAGTNFTSDLTGSSFVTMTAVSAIPEPSAALLGAIGLIALLRRRR